MTELTPTESALPDQVLNPDDPGDDTLRRYRYQITYAAILSVHMLDDIKEMAEIFCELHEDILIKKADGKFFGCQVKTKDIDLEPFDFEDEAIIKSFTRFISLEIKFPDQFTGFAIISNAGFAKVKPATCIKTLLSTAKSAEAHTLLTGRTKGAQFVRKLAADCGCTPEKVVEVLSKIDVESYCALQDIEMHLMNWLRVCPLLAGVSESKLCEIEKLMVAKFLNASSLGGGEAAAFAYLSTSNPSEEAIRLTIADKRISKSDLMYWLSAQKGTPVTVMLKDQGSIKDLAKGETKMTVKMDAGGIDADTIQMMRDFKFAFESHMMSWLFKVTPDEADARYAQVTGVTRNICQEAYDEQTTGPKNYGLQMLVDVRARLKERQRADGGVFLDCSYEHLLGAVGALTESCKIWWSEKFDLGSNG